jgi:hypothetical protein
MKSPPAVVKVVMEAVCHMLGVKPKKVRPLLRCRLDLLLPNPCCHEPACGTAPSRHLTRPPALSPAIHPALQVNDPANPAKKVDDFWGPAQVMLGDPGFLASLQEYDKDNISPAVVATIRPYIERPEFEPQVRAGGVQVQLVPGQCTLWCCGSAADRIADAASAVLPRAGCGQGFKGRLWPVLLGARHGGL